MKPARVLTLPLRRYDFGLEVRSATSKSEVWVGCSAEAVTKEELLSSEVFRTAVYALDQASTHIPHLERQVQAFIGEALVTL